MAFELQLTISLNVQSRAGPIPPKIIMILLKSNQFLCVQDIDSLIRTLPKRIDLWFFESHFPNTKINAQRAKRVSFADLFTQHTHATDCKNQGAKTASLSPSPILWKRRSVHPLMGVRGRKPCVPENKTITVDVGYNGTFSMWIWDSFVKEYRARN